MKIIISGGAGMIGSHCTEYFARKKYDVIIIDNLMRSTIFGSNIKSVEYNWHYLGKYKNVKRLKKDVRDREDMFRVFKKEKPDVVIHTAGQPGVNYSLHHPLEDYAINATGTLNLLEALHQTNKKGKFIYCSTNKVYGANVNGIPLKENKSRYAFKSMRGINEQFSVDLTGHTPYGVSKLVGDLYAQDYARIYGLHCGIFRMSCIYGTRQFGFEDQGWLAWFANRFIVGQPITIYGDGKQMRDILWVEDLARAFASFLKNSASCKGEVFNMGGGPANTLSLRELISFLEKISGKTVLIKYDNWRPFDQKVYVSDITKAKKILQWAPCVSPKEGVDKLFHWIRQNRHLF